MGSKSSDAAIRRTHVIPDQYIGWLVSVLYQVIVYGTLLFLMLPLLIVVIVSFQNQGYGDWPPKTLSLDWYIALPEKMAYLHLDHALTISVEIAVGSMIVTTIFGGLVAFGLARYDFEYSTALETLFLSPLIYPWLVTGFAILLIIGEFNSALGLGIQLSFWTLLVGHSIVTLPFPVRTTLASLQNFDRTLEEAAQDLGATELETYYRITFPLIKPGIVSGAIFAFILSFNQYIVSLFLSNSKTQTIPLQLFSLFHNQPPQQLAALGTVLMCAILIVVILAERQFGISEYM